MYLIRKHYIGGKYDFCKVEGTIDISVAGKKIPIDIKKLGYIEEDIGYWRKANAIHKWFVDNVQDGEDNCKYYYVSVEKLRKLLNTCKEVKEKAILEDGKIIKNVEEIAQILPTQEGFFFGCTDYDEWYMKDIYDTIEMLEGILKEEEELNKQGLYPEYQYHSSW